MASVREVKGVRQQEIVEAARKIIAIRGMEALTIRAIAQEVGISEGDVYRHFASKKQILLALIDDVEYTLLKAVDQAVSSKQRPLDSLESVLKAHLSYVEQRRGVSLIVIAETLHLADKDLRQRMFEVVSGYVARIEELLSGGMESGQIRQDVDPGMAALTFFALIHTTVTLWCLSDSDFSLARRYKPLWESYLANIAARGPDQK